MRRENIDYAESARHNTDVRPARQRSQNTLPAPSQQSSSSSFKRHWWLFGLALLLTILLSVGGTLLILDRHTSVSTDDKTLKAFSSIKNAVNYPLYYPAKLPPGFQFTQNSLTTQDGIVNYSYSYSGTKKLFVTEQPKPPIMEQVKKTQNVSTDIGKAYIADLEGHTTGFIVTDKTLIIFSNAGKSDTDQLSQLMSDTKPL